MRQLDIKEMEAVNGGCIDLEGARAWINNAASTIGKELKDYFATPEVSAVTGGMTAAEFFSKLFGIN